MTKIRLAIIFLFVGLLITSVGLYKKLKSAEADRDRFISNYEASLLEKDSITTNNRLLSFSIKELKYLNDSIANELLNTAKELKIKEKEIKALYYIKSQAQRVDTIQMSDTIFVKDLKIDTVIRDSWYQLDLSLQYPNTVVVSPGFTSEKHIIVHSKKILRKPSKCFFIRWFQKRDVVVEVEIKEKNPYIKETQNKFIEVIK
jgi:hypothetical protein|nr:MAG TPA: hypothetical protein [Crassvirales sp.]